MKLSRLHVERGSRVMATVLRVIHGATRRTDEQAVYVNADVWPRWDHFLKEAAAVKSAVDLGLVPWPPKDLKETPRPFPDLRWAVSDFNIRHYAVFSRLPSVDKFVDQIVAKIDAAPPPGYSKQAKHDQTDYDLSLMLQTIHGLLLWEHYGKKVYALDDETIVLFQHTDIPDMPARELTLPVGAFYLAFPAGKVFVEVDGREPLEAEGVMVSSDQTEGSDTTERTLTIQVALRMPKNLGPDHDAAVVCISFDIPMWPARSLRDVALGTGYNQVAPEGKLEDVIPQIVLNTILYLSSAHPILEVQHPIGAAASSNGNKALIRTLSRGAARRAAGRTSLPYLRLTPLDEEPQRDRTESHEEGAKLTAPTWTRGHWRHVAHGAGRSLRTLKWIRPFLRGGDLAAAIKMSAAVIPSARKRYLGGGAIEQ